MFPGVREWLPFPVIMDLALITGLLVHLHLAKRFGVDRWQLSVFVVLVGIYVFTIGLWLVYETGGQVPVGWMWFLAYGSVILASVTSSVTTLILEARTGGHG